LCRLTALRNLRITSIDGAPCGQANDALAALSALQQLTHLEIAPVRKAQLQHLQLPQLQQLRVSFMCTWIDEQLQLSHITSITQMVCEGCGTLFCGEQLPPNVLTLTWSDDLGFHRAVVEGKYSLQPLLALSKLQQLHLDMRHGAPEIEELAQLNSISSLTDLTLTYDLIGLGANPSNAAAVEEAAAAAAAAEAAAQGVWQLLQLKALSWKSRSIPAAVLQQLSALQGLARLDLQLLDHHDACQAQYQPAVLAAALKPLSKLQQLQLILNPARYQASSSESIVLSASGEQHAAPAAGESEGSSPSSSEQRGDAQGVAAFLQAIAGMSDLGQVYICLPVKLAEADAQQLSGMVQQLLPGWLGQCCAATVTAQLLKINDGQQGYHWSVSGPLLPA
jgi:hypothetical protein